LVKKAVTITGGTLIDGTGKKPIENAVIVIEDSKILAVGREGELKIPEGEVINASGKAIMPGLIDCHVHLTCSAEPDMRTSMLRPLPLTVLKAANNARATLEAGYTTVRDTGAIDRIDIGLRMAIEEGIITGPRILACGKAITITGGHCDWHLPELGIPVLHSFGMVADGADGILKATREQIKAGVDCIKLVVSGGSWYQGQRNMAAPRMTIEEIRTACEEAHRAGRRVCAHASSAESIKNAVLGGVDTIEHGHLIDEETGSMMRENGVFLCATLGLVYNLQERLEKLPGVFHSLTGSLSYPYEFRRERFQLAARIGVKIAPASDAGGPFYKHGDNALELTCMVDAGFSANEAIVAATKTAAEALGIGDITGTIEPGKLADLIIIDRDPLKDIKVLQERNKIQMVMKNGRVEVGPKFS
jgi:imidazolonepropionase-like amidohydrolase